jgi:hypothetical protein
VFRSFAHYLSYGATDQQTARRLLGSYTGLLVPGTVAAFQRAGTGGFVLTLSATAASPEYAIDPRFPLFQQRLPQPKKSHEALAELMGAPELIRAVDPIPDDFNDDLVRRVARGWVEFNDGYTDIAQKSFDKYATRLGEAIEPVNRRGPSYILPPYLIATPDEPGWWDVSTRLYEASAALTDPDRLVRVVATDTAAHLSRLLDACEQTRVAVWVSDLSEIVASSEDLVAYGRAIRRASGDQHKRIFALYGGFFSVLLRQVGLRGSSHGIGYGESRAWVELPQSGPPPARYYLPMVHRYVSQDLAYQLWVRNRPLAECPCAVCEGEAPLTLDYRQLMEHSVLCRAAEIDEWSTLSFRDMRRRLRADYVAFAEGVAAMSLAPGIASQARKSSQHMQSWISALAALRDDEGE